MKMKEMKRNMIPKHHNGEIHDPKNRIGQSTTSTEGETYYSGYFEHLIHTAGDSRNPYLLYLSDKQFTDEQMVEFHKEEGEPATLIIKRGTDMIEFDITVITDLVKK
jgi:hypothetical protein